MLNLISYTEILLIDFFFNLALYLYDMWIFIQLSCSLFITSVLPRKDFI